MLVPPLRADSDAFYFGFNNRLCQMLFVAWAAALGVAARAAGMRLPEVGRPGGSEQAPGLRMLWWTMGTTAGLALWMIWLIHPLGAIYDGAYFVDRIVQMSHGARPYKDFEFVYGSGPLYSGLALSRWLHIGAAGGYQLLWFLETVGAVGLLWQAIRWMEWPAGGRRGVYMLFWLLGLGLVPGCVINYSLFRYVVPLWGLIGLCRLDERAAGFRRRVEVVAFAAALTGVLLLCSQEEGLVFGLTVCVGLPSRRWAQGRAWVADSLCLAVVLASAVLAVSKTGAFRTMSEIGGGAFNLPVWPGPQVLLTMGSVLLCVLALALRRQWREALESQLWVIAVYGVGMLPGALGRCDAAHLLGYELPVLIATPLLLWRWIAWWRLSLSLIFCSFFLGPLIVAQWLGPPTLSKALLYHVYKNGQPQGAAGRALDKLALRMSERMLGKQRGREKIRALRMSTTLRGVDPHSLFPESSATVSVPFAYFPNKLNAYQAPGVDEGYFFGTLNMLTPAQVARKIAELASHPRNDLVLSPDGFAQCTVISGDPALMRELLLIPWAPRPRASSAYRVPLCRYIEENYAWVQRPTAETLGYGLMRHR